MNDLSTTIIGCGWLGKAFGETLVRSGRNVNGSVRSEEGQEDLKRLGIRPFHLDLQQSTSVPQEIIDSTETLVITLPPLHRDEPMRYHAKLVTLLHQFDASTRVIFTSSTGIYPQEEGHFDETYSFTTDQESTILPIAESAIRDTMQSHVILRLGGLIGPNRHPVRFLQGKEAVKNPLGSINFVHQGDCVRALSVMMDQAVSGTFNLVYPAYPTRKDYYISAAKHYDLTPPSFADEPQQERIISSQKIMQQVGFEFKFPIDHFPKLEFN